MRAANQSEEGAGDDGASRLDYACVRPARLGPSRGASARAYTITGGRFLGEYRMFSIPYQWTRRDAVVQAGAATGSHTS